MYPNTTTNGFDLILLTVRISFFITHFTPTGFLPVPIALDYEWIINEPIFKKIFTSAIGDSLHSYFLRNLPLQWFLVFHNHLHWLSKYSIQKYIEIALGKCNNILSKILLFKISSWSCTAWKRLTLFSSLWYSPLSCSYDIINPILCAAVSPITVLRWTSSWLPTCSANFCDNLLVYSDNFYHFRCLI